MGLDTEALRAEIIRAFPVEPMPAPEVVALQRDDCEGYEGNAAAAFLRGRRWPDLTLDRLLNDYPEAPFAIMAFLRAEGVRYYLPAFLLMTLDFSTGADVADMVTFHLKTPGTWGSPGIDARFEAIVTGLTPDQRRAVIHALQFLAAQYTQRGYPLNPALDALEGYWSTVPEFTDAELRALDAGLTGGRTCR